MKKNWIFFLAVFGLLAGVVAAYLFGIERKPQPPLFSPITSPFVSAIYANGIIESAQAAGSNISVYPDVSGKVTEVLVREGQTVKAGDTLLLIDDTVQRATVDQLKSQMLAAQATLNELKAQPRAEVLSVAKAQVGLAEANLRTARNQYDKRQAAFDANPKSISKDSLDTTKDVMSQAQSALDVARKQYELIRAGAWTFDIENQQKTLDALQQAYNSGVAILAKYRLTAQTDAVVLAINVTPGSYVAPQGTYDSYTQTATPLITMSTPQGELGVRCYVDEILVSRLPPADKINAVMMLRGGDQTKIPLEFVRTQPYVSPKIELSNQRQERVDLRVLPVLFKFSTQGLNNVYPGQLVDVYIGEK